MLVLVLGKQAPNSGPLLFALPSDVGRPTFSSSPSSSWRFGVHSAIPCLESYSSRNPHGVLLLLLLLFSQMPLMATYMKLHNQETSCDSLATLFYF